MLPFYATSSRTRGNEEKNVSHCTEKMSVGKKVHTDTQISTQESLISKPIKMHIAPLHSGDVEPGVSKARFPTRLFNRRSLISFAIACVSSDHTKRVFRLYA